MKTVIKVAEGEWVAAVDAGRVKVLEETSDHSAIVEFDGKICSMFPSRDEAGDSIELWVVPVKERV